MKTNEPQESKNGIASFLENHAKSRPVSFHVPGHKGSAFFERLGIALPAVPAADRDLTEIPGADNLFAGNGILGETARRYAEDAGSRRSFLLVNGSTCGIEAAILSVLGRGEEILVPRNCHRSVFSGIRLAGGRPAFLRQESGGEAGGALPAGVTPGSVEEGLRAHPAARAVLVTSPDYYGTLSPIGRIAEIVHRAGKILIVDQAHGAHLLYMDRFVREPAGLAPVSAERLGADIVIDSTHKTLASFTQTSAAHIFGPRADADAFADALMLVESSSPSYLLLESLERNIDILEKHGRELFPSWRADLDHFYARAADIRGLAVRRADPVEGTFDDTKLLLDLTEAGWDGRSLERELERRGIWPELSEGGFVLCVTGIGSVRSDYERLLEALQEIARQEGPFRGSGGGFAGISTGGSFEAFNGVFAGGMKAAETAEIPERTERVPVEGAEGRVCALSVVPYPPGIPLFCPGEILRKEPLELLRRLMAEGREITGLDERGQVLAGRCAGGMPEDPETEPV